MNVGIVGCGNISDIYFKNCKRLGLTVLACTDAQMDRAKAKAAQYDDPGWCTMEDLLADEDIRIVINLTPPQAHFEVAAMALSAGKHVYNEKPLAVTREQAQKLMAFAAEHQLRIGSAPDTFLGSALQAARKAIDSGMIGEPVGAAAFMMCSGHESWHPDPEFFYQPGGGPLFDMGPYYLTALIHLLGPVRRVTGSVKATFARRVISNGPKKGTKFDVSVPTHVTGLLDFHDDTTATLMMSFDTWHHELPTLEIYGTGGSLSLPDPNLFGGTVRARKAKEDAWQPVLYPFGYDENSRGVGVADMAKALEEGRPHRASAELAYHALDVMHAIYDASESGRHVEIASRCERPEPMKEGLKFGEV